MKKVFKKIGSILFCLLPFLLAFGLQLIVSIIAVVVKSFSLLAEHPELLSDIELYLSTLMNSIMGDFSIWISAIYAVIAALALGFWYWKKFAPKKVPKRKPGEIINLKMFVGVLALMVGLQYLSTYIVGLVYLINPNWYYTYESLMENVGFTDISVILAIYSVIIAPISEELIFRGVTLHYAKKTMPFWVANIFQALLFGVFHANVVQGTYAFVVGLFCGYVCYKGDSIYLSILFHMLFNIWGTFVPENFLYSGNSVILQFLMFLLTVAITLLGFYLYSSGAKKKENTI
ncbi:CPBP family intramembrane glutamic endopeptidase [Roseburia sp. 499]|uniref:CPBP family intramembrane glutamic endopeptidase n=1 Tax=Roseburia sp. 499 TaxID=1261634 RepID=UPI0009515558|nr:type II CAAX endopeptidase family protein [Roseburia sp. 499]WVK68763.1 type II CAAX endopeptidase family protein [Roseburia sp. 499]